MVKKGECRTTVMSFGIPSIALLTELMPFWYWTIYFLAGRTSGHPEKKKKSKENERKRQ